MTEEIPKMHSDRPSLDEIVRALREIVPDLADRYGVKSLGFFGSCVRGEADDRSDLDILVEFEDPPTLWELIRLERELGDELGDELGVKVDLVMKKSQKPGIGEAILKEVVAV